jgi:hypothetical protein
MSENHDPLSQAGLPAGEWETLAALTGFKPEPPPGQHSSQPLTQPPQLADAIAIDSEESVNEIALDEMEEPVPQKATPKTDLLDPEDWLESEEEQAATKPTLWTNPWAKSGFVASIIGVGVAGVGLFLWSVQNIKPVVKQPEPPRVPQTADKTPVDPAQEQIGNLKTLNALGSQAQTLNQQAQMRNGPTPKGQARPSPSTSRTQTSPPVSPTRTVATANYSSVPYTPVRMPPAIAPTSSPVRSFAESPVTPTVDPPAPSVDPQTAWQQALDTGSYGQMPSASSPDLSDETAAPVESLEPHRPVAISGGNQMPSESPPALPAETATLARSPIRHSPAWVSRVSPPETTAVEFASDWEDSRYQADASAILSGQPSDFDPVLAGTMASATLQTPIFWAEDLAAEALPQRFSIRLNDAVATGDGTIALPRDTQLIAQVHAISHSGLVQLAVTHAVIPTPDGEEVVSLPSDAILITREQGKPLLAEREKSGRRELARLDRKRALYGALGQVGQLLNRPESTTTSPYLASTSIRNGDANLVGGVLEGAFDSLAEQAQQRHQQEMQEIVNRPSLWVVPAGQPLQVFIHQSFEIARHENRIRLCSTCDRHPLDEPAERNRNPNGSLDASEPSPRIEWQRSPDQRLARIRNEY